MPRCYSAVEEMAARKSALQHVAAELFKGSAELLFTHLVSDKRLTAAERARVRRISERRVKPEKG